MLWTEEASHCLAGKQAREQKITVFKAAMVDASLHAMDLDVQLVQQPTCSSILQPLWLVLERLNKLLQTYSCEISGRLCFLTELCGGESEWFEDQDSYRE